MGLSENERYFLAIDREEQIVAGLCYTLLEPTVAHLDGLAVADSLKGRGLEDELLEEFCLRMSSQGGEAVNTHFIFRDFYLAHGFHVDERWGGLVRFLPREEGESSPTLAPPAGREGGIEAEPSR